MWSSLFWLAWNAHIESFADVRFQMDKGIEHIIDAVCHSMTNYNLTNRFTCHAADKNSSRGPDFKRVNHHIHPRGPTLAELRDMFDTFRAYNVSGARAVSHIAEMAVKYGYGPECLH